MKEQYIYNYKTKTRYIDYDMNDRLKLSSVLTFLQESASYGAEEMGCGTDFLWPRAWGFIVTGYYTELYKNVPVGSNITVKTWALPAKHVIFEREFQFITAEGELIGAAVSRWCLYDVKNQKLLPASRISDDSSREYCTDKALPFKDWKIPTFPTDDLSPDYCVAVGSSNYDHYMHINNTFYADFCANCFSVEEWKSMKVKSFQIAFEEQCFEGDMLQFYKQNISEKDYIILGKKENGRVAIKAKLIFE